MNTKRTNDYCEKVIAEIVEKERLVNEIESEFAKYNSDVVNLNLDENEINDDEYYQWVSCPFDYYGDEDEPYPTTPVCFKKRNDDLIIECEDNRYFNIDVEQNRLSNDDLDILLYLIKHPITKKANNK